MMRRQSGIAVPLFSLVSTRGWGIGEFIDLAEFSRWVTEAGQSAVQLLPIHEMPPIESSPYSAMTAMALDPIYLSVPDVPDFNGLGGDEALDGADRSEIARLRQSPRIEYAAVRRLKGSLAAARVRSLPQDGGGARLTTSDTIRSIHRRAVVVA